ncbi:glutaredoxin family protein [Aquabacterium sp. OR-4]|uniref:glutaredoxin family protein n=1 Tax=Aquabacterium sp. OR-4 TaxID=2978127 RepID=UPI0021B4C6CA|nr:glutaredoxin domain-containing protein [Aquabacterium sp. OR-4]MDT7836402.1 glutaredoxin domain-containing protein [Aquabacterium sp. OR-4]
MPTATDAPAERPLDKRSLWVALALILATTAGVSWWQQQREARLGRELAAQARPGDIHMLSSTQCGYCTQARRWLQAQQVPFTECFVERDAACAAQFRALMQPGTPVLLVRGQVQLGFSPQQLRQRLAEPPG